jgi:serine/threonine-protein kinase
MGSVYLAEHPTLRKRAAVKLLHAEFAQKTIVIEHFFTEARAVSEIGHQHIVDVLDFGVIEGLNLPFMLMEFLEGCSLQELLRRQKKLDPRVAVNITLQLLSALSAAHARKIIHRDLKPDNVYLIERGEEINYVKLLDFGVAKLLNSQATNLTLAGSLVGTPQYMSPEQAQGGGSNDIDARADVYSVGVMLFELLCGQLPFQESNFGDLVIAHVTKAPPAPRSVNPSISRGLEEVILKALQKRREDRYFSADEMASALRNAPLTSSQVSGPRPQPQEFSDQTTTLTGGTGEIMAPRIPRRPKARGRSGLGLYVVVGLVGLGVGLGSVLALRETLFPKKDGAQNTGSPVQAATAPALAPVGGDSGSAPSSAASTQPAPVEVAEATISLTAPKGALVSVLVDKKKRDEKVRVPGEISVPQGSSVELWFSLNGRNWKASLGKVSASREFATTPPKLDVSQEEPPKEIKPPNKGTINPYETPKNKHP